ncbi:MAG TPA: hypothetical protein EYG67_05000 [Campylobacterales bacterium]|nr:hypothetical protein [Campylobacterales bacterium]
MRRRDKALIAILLPIVLVTLLSYVHPVSYNILMGYMLGVVLVFKSSLLSLWFVSKLKIVAFIKGLTFIQAILLGIKRWFIDNMLSQWLEKYIFSHLKKPFNELLQYYQAVSFRAKLKNFFVIVFPLGIGIWIMYLTDILSHIALFVELKVIVIGFFKTLWVIFAKIFAIVPMILGWISGSWLAPILEVFALSYLLSFIEKLLGANNPITRFFNYIGDKLNDFLSYLGLLNDKHIEPILNNTLSRGSQTFANKISSMIRNKKIREEHLYFDNFRNIILRGHINAYHSFEGMEDITDKTKLYSIINEKTKDNIDIIAYVSRNGKGEILEEQYKNNYYHDIFLLKGIASNQNHGVKEHLDTKIDHSDFWVLNSSLLPVWIKSNSNNIEPKLLEGNEVRLIKTKQQTAFDCKDIYFEHEGVIVYPTSIIPTNETFSN